MGLDLYLELLRNCINGFNECYKLTELENYVYDNDFCDDIVLKFQIFNDICIRIVTGAFLKNNEIVLMIISVGEKIKEELILTNDKFLINNSDSLILAIKTSINYIETVVKNIELIIERQKS